MTPPTLTDEAVLGMLTEDEREVWEPFARSTLPIAPMVLNVLRKLAAQRRELEALREVEKAARDHTVTGTKQMQDALQRLDALRTARGGGEE